MLLFSLVHVFFEIYVLRAMVYTSRAEGSHGSIEKTSPPAHHREG
jgi:hypothetical protein